MISRRDKPRPWPIVLGLDPGTRVMGYGAIVVAPDGPRLLSCGVLRAQNSLPVSRRLAKLAEGFEALLDEIVPHWVAVETVFVARNVKSAFRIGEARGMVLATVGRRDMNLAEVSPAEAKKAVIGHGGGSKEQVAAMVRLHLGAERLDLPLDATDALALALAQLRRMQSPARPVPGSSGAADRSPSRS